MVVVSHISVGTFVDETSSRTSVLPMNAPINSFGQPALNTILKRCMGTTTR